MGFAVHVQNNGDFVTLRCLGRLVFDEGTNVLRAAVVAQKENRLLLDLAEMEAIDAAGVGTLISLHQRVSSGGGTLVVARPNARVLRVLRLTRADTVLNLHLPEQNAIAALFTRATAPMRDWMFSL
jgi:anti-anti-sigma factor